MTKWGKYWDWKSIPKSSLKSRVRSINEAKVEGKVGEYGTSKQLVGGTDIPTERLSIGVTSFKAGDRSPFHFHLHERVYYIISGHAILRDIEGRTYDCTAGTAVYLPAGMEGAHGWDMKEDVQLIVIRPLTGDTGSLQFNMDESNPVSDIKEANWIAATAWVREGEGKITKGIY